MIITFQHFKSIPYKSKIGYCSPVGRQFFKRHNLDWLEFVKSGIDEKILLDINDVMATRLVEFARKQENPDG